MPCPRETVSSRSRASCGPPSQRGRFGGSSYRNSTDKNLYYARSDEPEAPEDSPASGRKGTFSPITARWGGSSKEYRNKEALPD